MRCTGKKQIFKNCSPKDSLETQDLSANAHPGETVSPQPGSMDETKLLLTQLSEEKAARKRAESSLANISKEVVQLRTALENAESTIQRLSSQLKRQEEESSQAILESEQKYRRIIENMELGLLVVDNKGIIVRVYDGFCAMTGYSREELIGMSHEMLLPPEWMAHIEAETAKRRKGISGLYEVELLRKDGRRIWVLISGTPMYNAQKKIIGSIGIHYDVTEQKKLQQELEEARRLALAAQEAEKLFLATMSHEIRTPLNAIIGMTYLLRETPLDPEQEEYINLLRSAAGILQRLISDILDLSRIEAGQVEIRERAFDLVAMINALLKTFEIKIDPAQVRLSVAIDPALDRKLIGDDLMLNQILLNLLDNAVKFTERGQIVVRVDKVGQTGQKIKIRFSVSDTGIGIDADRLTRIFDKYQQANPEIKAKYGGTGLGLAITLKLVELQGGRIWVESTPGKGSAFYVELEYLPVATSAVPAHSLQEDQKTVALPPSPILIVEDNPMNRRYIEVLLQKWGIPFDVAEDGETAILLCQVKSYCLIIMDLQLPGRDGFETTHAIRNDSNRNQATPVVAVSAAAGAGDCEKARQSGINGFLPKPFTPSKLEELLLQFACQTEVGKVENAAGVEGSLRFSTLKELYGNDADYAKEMFNTFFEHTLPELAGLKYAVELETWQALSCLAHRLKPAFVMVGLPKISGLLEELEVTAIEYPEKHRLLNLVEQVEAAVRSAMPSLEKAVEYLEKRQCFWED